MAHYSSTTKNTNLSSIEDRAEHDLSNEYCDNDFEDSSIEGNPRTEALGDNVHDMDDNISSENKAGATSQGTFDLGYKTRYSSDSTEVLNETIELIEDESNLVASALSGGVHSRGQLVSIEDEKRLPKNAFGNVSLDFSLRNEIKRRNGRNKNEDNTGKLSLDSMEERNFSEMEARVADCALLDVLSSSLFIEASTQRAGSGVISAEEKACDSQSQSRAEFDWATMSDPGVTNQPQDADPANTHKRERDQADDHEGDIECGAPADVAAPTCLDTIWEEEESEVYLEHREGSNEKIKTEASHLLRHSTSLESQAPPDSNWSALSRHSHNNTERFQNRRESGGIAHITSKTQQRKIGGKGTMSSTTTSINEILLGSKPSESQSPKADESANTGDTRSNSNTDTLTISPWYDGLMDDPMSEVPMVFGLVAMLVAVFWVANAGS